MADYYYTKTHEWIAKIDGQWRVGITNYAQEQLGDITFVEIAEPGSSFKQGDALGTIESIKSVSEIYAPVDLTIAEKNQATEDDPAIINQDPQGEGYLFVASEVNQDQLSGLMDEAAYQEFLSQQEA